MTTEFSFHLAHIQNPINEKSDIWHLNLPTGHKEQTQSLTYGEYFNALRFFLNLHLNEILDQSGTEISREEPVKIFLKKHGEFYHPACIEIISKKGDSVRFVANFAASEAGISLIKREYQLLNHLNTKFSDGHIPITYMYSELEYPTKNKTCVFIGDWFENYHEFHITCEPKTGHQKYIVWNQEKGNFYLTNNQVTRMYIKTAEILTSFYNTDTFEQIFPWHHAAGDFIINCDGGNISLKLITVRQYTNQIESDGEAGIEEILDALLYFLLNLSIRTRLDRRDGTNETLWANDIAVRPTLTGFFKSLHEKKSHLIPGSIPEIFKKYIEFNYTEQDIQDIAESILSSYNPKSSDFSVVKKNIKAHVRLFHSEINKIDHLRA